MLNLETLINIINSTISSFYLLIIPAIIFTFLALFLKGLKRSLLSFKKNSSQMLLNLMIFIVNTILIYPIVVILNSFFDSIQFRIVDNIFWTELPTAVVIFSVIFIGDFIGYWRHRLEHSRLLWSSHAIHHSDDRMTWLTLERFHPINRITTFAIDSTVLILLGFPVYAIIVNRLVRHYYGYFIHANLNWRMGILDKIFVSPIMHRWHHSSEYKAYNTNYATVFSLFDRLFGTYRVPKESNIPLGVKEYMGEGLFGQLSYPFKIRTYKRNKN